MTLPTLTYQHKEFDDFRYVDEAAFKAVWDENLVNMVGGDVTASIIDADILKLNVVFDQGATDEHVYYKLNFDDFLSNTYKRYVMRVKTSHASAGAKAKVVLVFTSGNQEIVPLDYYSAWTAFSGQITADKTVSEIRIYADDDGTNGTFQVYYDFILLTKDIITLPDFVNNRLHAQNVYVDLHPPGRLGEHSQYMGMKSPEIRLNGKMDTDAGWEGAAGITGEALYILLKSAENDVWNWFTSDLLNCKMTVRDLNLNQEADSKSQRVWDMLLKMANISGGTSDNWGTLQYFDLH